MKKILLTALSVLFTLCIHSQEIALKTNALYWGTTTMNLGLELATSANSSLDIMVGYNPWTLGDNKKLKHIGIQPEYRYWFCQKFTGHFIGLHGHYAYYNVSNIRHLANDGIRKQGYLLGGGIGYGYQWILSDRWNLQANIGLGYAYLDYDKYECKDCGTSLGSENKHYIGLTKLGLSIVYIIQ